MQKTNIENQLIEKLKELHLPAFRRSYRTVAQSAIQNQSSYEQFLLDLCEIEADSRRNNKVERLLKESKLPLTKTFESFDKSRLPIKISRQLSLLCSGHFLDNSENLIVIGNPGSGKTHLVCALGHELVANSRRVLFTPSSHLVQEIQKAKQSLTLSKYTKKLDKYDVVIIDDIGYLEHQNDESESLFHLLTHRYERKSIIITSNLPFSKWDTIFKSEMTSIAAVDRLIHHGIVFEMNIDSYRLQKSKEKEITDDTIKTVEN